MMGWTFIECGRTLSSQKINEADMLISLGPDPPSYLDLLLQVHVHLSTSTFYMYTCM